MKMVFFGNMIVSFWPWAIFRGKLLVLGSALGGSSQDRRKWLISMIDKFDNFLVPGVISCPHGLCVAYNLQSTY